ncbi:MAG TPA: RES family NAD+ phosphorylase [Bacillus sp. (in: firmicutes)]|uniref:RES family NAD+ phosphorylase n=1 Tax=Paenibacillus ehimensis TaxID=79264 RepID=UPI002CA95EB5|nr:RES family NAD+ phosphorylase [Paenibacillus ehimensis]MEC0209851.1 RES family NAD+ phosphorylase [Paenibacillus ehimensis]HWO74639.1 RES family NAD+ phosphorylase [Bacillus sp. (in: firmicutes)]
MESNTKSNGFVAWPCRITEGEKSSLSELSSCIYSATPSDTRQQWADFVNKFKTRRFFVDEEEILLKHHVTQIIRDNVYPISHAETFYRARINREDNTSFKNEDLEAPPEHLVGNGRLNQRRVRCLYIADHPKTAIAEMRPWRKALLTVAEVRLKSTITDPINVIDFVPKTTDSPDSFKRIIGEFFSRPVRPDISDLEYLPTQCIAEFVKRNGYAGIRYESAVNPGGVNYCLFDPDCMEIKISHEIEVTYVIVESQKAP